MPGFHKSFQLDVTTSSACYLVYVKRSITAAELRTYKPPFKTQAIPFKINLRNKNWLIIGIYKPPSQNSEYFI